MIPALYPAPVWRAHLRVPVLLLALALPGCASLPEPQQQIGPRSVESFATQKSLKGQSGEWPTDAWWEQIGDAQLSQLIEEGIAGASDLRVAWARFDRARAFTTQAKAPLLPSASASAEGGATKQSYNYLFPRDFAPQGWPDYGQGSLGIQWELDFWGKNRAALAAARSEAEAEDLDGWLADTFMVKRAFRDCAEIAGLIDRRIPGLVKTGRQVTFSTDLIYDVLRRYQPDHLLLRCAIDDVKKNLIDVDRLDALLDRSQGRIVHHPLERLSPFAVPAMLALNPEQTSSNGDLEDELLAEVAERLASKAFGSQGRATTPHRAIGERQP